MTTDNENIFGRLCTYVYLSKSHVALVRTKRLSQLRRYSFRTVVKRMHDDAESMEP